MDCHRIWIYHVKAGIFDYYKSQKKSATTCHFGLKIDFHIWKWYTKSKNTWSCTYAKQLFIYSNRLTIVSESSWCNGYDIWLCSQWPEFNSRQVLILFSLGIFSPDARNRTKIAQFATLCTGTVSVASPSNNF